MGRWADVDEVKKIINSVGIDTVEDQIYVCELIDKTPSIDIVRCGECKHYYNRDPQKIPTASIQCFNMHPDDYCSYGERSE